MSLPLRSECRCSCHQTPQRVMHIAPCCVNDPEPVQPVQPDEPPAPPRKIQVEVFTEPRDRNQHYRVRIYEIDARCDRILVDPTDLPVIPGVVVWGFIAREGQPNHPEEATAVLVEDLETRILG